MQLLRHRHIAVPAFILALIAAVAMAQPAAAFRDRDCSDFKTHAQAQHFYKNHNPHRDPHGLDADRDGIACEDLP